MHKYEIINHNKISEMISFKRSLTMFYLVNILKDIRDNDYDRIKYDVFKEYLGSLQIDDANFTSFKKKYDESFPVINFHPDLSEIRPTMRNLANCDIACDAIIEFYKMFYLNYYLAEI